MPAPFCRPVDQYNYAPPNYLLRPLERWQISGLGSVEVGERVEAYAQLFYTNKENAYQQAPDASNPTSFGQERGTLLVPQAATNPLFTQPLRDFFAANAAYFDPDGDGTYAIRNTAWQIEQLGPRNVTTVTDGYLLTGGFRGDADFGAPTARFSGGVDPCVVDNTPTDAQKQLCIAQGVPPEIVDNLQVGASQGYQVRSGGNEELIEEESDTFTAGLVYTPTRWPNLSMSLDFYDISVDGAITQVSAQALVDSCFETLDANGAPCQSIARLSSGNIDQVNAPLLNVATRQVQGLDLQVVSTFDLPEWLSVTQGGADLGLTFVVSNQFEDTTKLLPDAPEVNCAGNYGGTCSSDGTRITPDFRALVIAGWNSGPANVNLQFNYIGDLELSENAFPNENGTLDSTLYINLNGGVSIGDRFRIFGGIQNLTDKQPPVLGFRAGGDASTNVTLFDPIGRKYFVGASASFGE